MMRCVRSLLLPIFGLTIALGLAACKPAPSPLPTPAPTTSPTLTPAPAPTPAGPKVVSVPTSKPITLLFTQGLGTILTGIQGIDADRDKAVANRLKELRAKYGDALFADGGDAIGPLSLSETHYGLPTFRLFDENRYAAAALSGRDGVHTFGFYRLLPAGARVATPLVGTFSHPKTASPPRDYYPVHEAYSEVEIKGGAKFRFFGVNTSATLSGIAPPPLRQVRFGTSVAEQAGYVTAHLDPGYLPIILSDMLPAENDELARRLKRNALVFEGGYPWRLAQPPPDYKPTRDIGPVKIVSHPSPNFAEVVTLPLSLECKEAKLVASERIWEPANRLKDQPKPAAKGRPNPATLASDLVRTHFTQTFLLPDVGTSVGQKVLLQEIGLPYDDRDTTRTPAPGDFAWTPPPWMQETLPLRLNPIVYRYGLYWNKRFMAHVYRIRQILVRNYSIVELLITADKDHCFDRGRFLFPTLITNNTVRTDEVLERLKGKRWDEIAIEDWPERAGAEWFVDNVVREIQMALAFDELYK